MVATHTEKVVLDAEDRASAEFKKAAGGFDSMASKFTKGAKAIGVAFGAAAFIGLGKQMVSLAVDAEEAASAFATAFGPATAKAAAFVDEFANKAGFASFELEQMLAITGSVVQGIGATEDASADLAIQMATLAGDVASFSNAQGGARAVMGALQSAINGEREALKTYGLALSETEVQQRALTDTGKTSVDELTRLEKAQATVNLAYDKAGKSLGDLDRTQGSAANQLRALGGEARELGADIGAALLPAIRDMLPAIRDMLPAIGEAGTAIADLVVAVGPLVSALVTALGPALEGVAWYFRLLAKGATSISAIYGNDVADGVLRLGEAQDFLNTQLAAGADPASVLASAVLHFGDTTALTADNVAELNEVAGLSDERLREVGWALVEVAKYGDAGGISVEALSQAFGLGLQPMGPYITAVDAAGDAVTVLSEKELAAAAVVDQAADEAAAAAARFKTSVVDSIMGAAKGLDGAVDQIEESLGELQANFEESIEQHLEFYANLAILSARGQDDLALILEAGGTKNAAAAAQAVDDIAAAADFEQVIDDAEADAEAVAEAWRLGLERNYPSLVAEFAGLGVDLTTALGENFSVDFLLLGLQALRDSAAATRSSVGGTAKPAEGNYGGPYFASGGIVPGALGAPLRATVHGGEEVLTMSDRQSITASLDRLSSSMGSAPAPTVNVTVTVETDPAGRVTGVRVEDQSGPLAATVERLVRR